MKFSVIITTIGRPSFDEAIGRVRDADELIILKDDFKNRREQVALVNEAGKKAQGDVFIILGERVIISKDWKQKTIEALNHLDNFGIVSFWHHILISCAVTKSFLDKFMGGNIWSPDYIHYCADIEMGDVARKYGRFLERFDIFERQYDKDYVSNPYSEKCRNFDVETYVKRTRLGWPNERVRSEEEKSFYLKP